MAKKEHVVIVGAGFGGVRVAKGLEGKAKVTLVTPSDRFVYLPLIHELVSDSETPRDVSKKLSDILTSTKVIYGLGEKVEGNELILRSGERVPFDKLVVAIGAEPNDFGIPGVREHTFSFYSIQDALLANGNLKARASQIGGRPFKVIVAGASFTGIEVAGEIKELLTKLDVTHEIQLVDAGAKLFPFQSEEFRDSVHDAIKRNEFDLLQNHRILETDSNTMIVEFEGKRIELHADIMMWCAGAKPRQIDGVDSQVRMTLQSKRRDDIFVLGDAAFFPRDLAVPKLAQTAEAQAPVVVHNLLKPTNMQEYKPAIKGVILSIGQKFAIAEIGSTVVAGQVPWQLKKRLYKTKIAFY